ncbi:MAG: hypothetical protein ACE5F3_04560 [Mariprofundaceae bacterium]
MPEIRVECYAGYKGEQTPCRFFIDTQKVEVIEVVDSWLAPDHHYFKVRGDDAYIYILRHDISSDHWEITMYEKTC